MKSSPSLQVQAGIAATVVLLLLQTPPLISAQGVATDTDADAVVDLTTNPNDSVISTTSASASGSSTFLPQPLPLEEFNAIRLSESPNDFNMRSNDSVSERLWLDAAGFEYMVATSHSPEFAKTSNGFHPYIICSTSNDENSGMERQQAIATLFQSTPGVNASHYYGVDGDAEDGVTYIINNDDISCSVLRAYNDTISQVYQHAYANDETVAEWMTVTPIHSSMKMAPYLVSVMESWFVAVDSDAMPGDMVSIGNDPSFVETVDETTIQVKVLGLHMILCPGVQNFEHMSPGTTEEERTDATIASGIKGFITENGGENVRDTSFYYQRVMNGDDDSSDHSERMEQWSDAITTVMNWTNTTDQANPCLDTIIGNNMVFTVNQAILEVKSKVSFWEGNALAEDLGMTTEQMEVCVWYMTYALGVNTEVCSIEPRTDVRTLCKDGTSDLTKCTPDGIAPTPAPPGNSSSRSRSSSRSTMIIMISMAMSCVLLGATSCLL